MLSVLSNIYIIKYPPNTGRPCRQGLNTIAAIVHQERHGQVDIFNFRCIYNNGYDQADKGDVSVRPRSDTGL